MFHTNPEINAQIVEAIAMFAKTNKVNKAKTEEFISLILAMLPKAGRQVSDESMRIRKALKDHMANFKGSLSLLKKLHKSCKLIRLM